MTKQPTLSVVTTKCGKYLATHGHTLGTKHKKSQQPLCADQLFSHGQCCLLRRKRAAVTLNCVKYEVARRWNVPAPGAKTSGCSSRAFSRVFSHAQCIKKDRGTKGEGGARRLSAAGRRRYARQKEGAHARFARQKESATVLLCSNLSLCQGHIK